MQLTFHLWWTWKILVWSPSWQLHFSVLLINIIMVIFSYYLLLEKHIERLIFASKTLNIRKGVFLLLCCIVSVASENFQMADCVWNCPIMHCKPLIIDHVLYAYGLFSCNGLFQKKYTHPLMDGNNFWSPLRFWPLPPLRIPRPLEPPSHPDFQAQGPPFCPDFNVFKALTWNKQ